MWWNWALQETKLKMPFYIPAKKWKRKSTTEVPNSAAASEEARGSPIKGQPSEQALQEVPEEAATAPPPLVEEITQEQLTLLNISIEKYGQFDPASSPSKISPTKPPRELSELLSPEASSLPRWDEGVEGSSRAQSRQQPVNGPRAEVSVGMGVLMRGAAADVRAFYIGREDGGDAGLVGFWKAREESARKRPAAHGQDDTELALAEALARVPREDREYAYHDRIRAQLELEYHQQSQLWSVPPPPATPELQEYFGAQRIPVYYRDGSEVAAAAVAGVSLASSSSPRDRHVADDAQRASDAQRLRRADALAQLERAEAMIAEAASAADDFSDAVVGTGKPLLGTRVADPHHAQAEYVQTTEHAARLAAVVKVRKTIASREWLDALGRLRGLRRWLSTVVPDYRPRPPPCCLRTRTQ